MADFFMVATKMPKKGVVEIFPKFIMGKSKDLMVRGGDFYAVWLEEIGLWSEDEQDLINLVDKELDIFAQENASKYGDSIIKVLHMWDADSGSIDKWHKYCQKQCRDNFKSLDDKLIFANTKPKKTDYATRRLPYPLEPGETPAWDAITSVLYSEEERHKIEWAIGAVVSGDSKHIQKFCVFYGESGSGKSTIMNIMEQLFEGYFCTFDSKALGQTNSSFALEPFKQNPLVGIEHDGNLSKIEDNTRINSLVSHEIMTVNEKFTKLYSNRFRTFLFMGTNKPVKITDAKSGLTRRLIDISPTGNLIPSREYKKLVKQIPFELGHIAQKCLDVYLDDPDYYEGYVPISMMSATNDFYNFMEENYFIFKENDGVSLKQAWEMYKTYNQEAMVAYPLPQRAFKEEFKNYWERFEDRAYDKDGQRVRNYYSGFKTSKFEKKKGGSKKKAKDDGWIVLKAQPSIFDKECANCPAQLANDKGTPMRKWSSIKTTLKDILTTSLHYVKVPQNHIVIDFDIKDENGNKSLERNLAEANKWPATYCETSKSGSGIHLHYIYDGDPTELSNSYAPDIEIKVFKDDGNATLRRMLTLCTANAIAHISSGLPKKEQKKMLNIDTIKSEKGLRTMIKRNLNKEFHPGTKPSVDFIFKILEDAYNSGLQYDVSDMQRAVSQFAMNSTNNSEYCLKLVKQMKWKSKEAESNDAKTATGASGIIFYDVEVFPNLFIVNYKRPGEQQKVERLINPTANDIERLIKFNLVGFNNRRYDNHILYGRLMGYNNEQLYNLSQRIVTGDKTAFFGEAYNLSFTDIYDYCSNINKMSLKKWEIKLGIHHQELGLPWDQPVPEELWQKVAEYCDNDVIATEAVWNATQDDFKAREILATLAGLTPNDTTNTCTTRFIFGSDRNPQKSFNYRNMGKIGDFERAYGIFELDGFDKKGDPIMKPVADDDLPNLSSQGRYNVFYKDPRYDKWFPIFPGYTYNMGKSTYRGEEVSEGGYVYSEPGMYGRTELDDVASMHPHSIFAEMVFGDEYTTRFYDIVRARIAIKHGDFDAAGQMFNGALKPYLTSPETAAALANALKTAINSVYGLTFAQFANPFRDPRNKDNIVAKRGALFMVNLKHEVQKRGFIVAHIKTDSIKVPDATPELLEFIFNYGKLYGYTFEHEATYDRMCLIDKAQYIARYKGGKKDGKWTATGAQFAEPVVFKTLFSHEPILLEDYFVTKSVQTEIYLDFNEELYSDEVAAAEKEYDKLCSNYKKGVINDTDFERDQERLLPVINAGHNYRFVGRVGAFVPVKPGCGGGYLVSKRGDKYYAVTGTKRQDGSGEIFRFKEAEIIKMLGLEGEIDMRYFDDLVEASKNDLYIQGDFDWFVSDEPYVEPAIVDGRPEYMLDVPYHN